jgi:hypothetical protein
MYLCTHTNKNTTHYENILHRWQLPQTLRGVWHGAGSRAGIFHKAGDIAPAQPL